MYRNDDYVEDVDNTVAIYVTYELLAQYKISGHLIYVDPEFDSSYAVQQRYLVAGA